MSPLEGFLSILELPCFVDCITKEVGIESNRLQELVSLAAINANRIIERLCEIKPKDAVEIFQGFNNTVEVLDHCS